MVMHRAGRRRLHLHRPTDRLVGEVAVALLALAVMTLAVLFQIGGTR